MAAPTLKTIDVHPTASVDARAVLADGVTIGPACVIEGEVHIGAGTQLIGHNYLQGPLTLGRDNLLYPFACLGFAPQSRAHDPQHPGSGLRIGDRNVFRESVTVHRAITSQPTTLGDDNYIMANAHIGHDCIVGNNCTLANCAAIGGHVQLHDGAIISGNAVVHQFCRVGRLAMLSGVMGISQDLPPFCTCYVTRTVGSLNIVGLRCAGLRQHIVPLKQAFDMLYRSAHSNRGAIEKIRQTLSHDPLCLELAQFIETSERGITPYQGRAAVPT